MRKKLGKRQHGVQAVEIGLHLAFTLARSEVPMALRDLARSAGLGPSKAHRYLVSLCRAGVVRQDGPNSAYDLGTGALNLGLAAQRRLDEYRLADEAIRELNDETGLTVSLAVWGNNGPTVVHRREGMHAVTVSARVGTALSVIATNAGRLFATFLPKRMVEPLVEAEFGAGKPAFYMGKRLNRAAFDVLLETIRRQRLCRNRGDTVTGIDAVSAPVFNSEGRIIMAISIMGGHGGLDLAFHSAPVKALQRMASGLSESLGYTPPSSPPRSSGAARPQKAQPNE